MERVSFGRAEEKGRRSGMTKEKIKYLKDAIHDAQCAQTEVTANMHEVVNDVEKGLLLM